MLFLTAARYNCTSICWCGLLSLGLVSDTLEIVVARQSHHPAHHQGHEPDEYLDSSCFSHSEVDGLSVLTDERPEEEQDEAPRGDCQYGQGDDLRKVITQVLPSSAITVKCRGDKGVHCDPPFQCGPATCTSHYCDHNKTMTQNQALVNVDHTPPYC